MIMHKGVSAMSCIGVLKVYGASASTRLALLECPISHTKSNITI